MNVEDLPLSWLKDSDLNVFDRKIHKIYMFMFDFFVIVCVMMYHWVPP